MARETVEYLVVAPHPDEYRSLGCLVPDRNYLSPDARHASARSRAARADPPSQDDLLRGTRGVVAEAQAGKSPLRHLVPKVNGWGGPPPVPSHGARVQSSPRP